MPGTALLIVNPQNDFAEGAQNAMQSTINYIQTHGNKLDAIIVMRETHNSFLNITNAAWWVDNNNERPAEGTQITIQDVQDGKWKAAHIVYAEDSLKHLRYLDENKLPNLTIYPQHGIKDTQGWMVTKLMQTALNTWATMFDKNIVYINNETLIANTELNHLPSKYEQIKVAGQTLAHVANSVTHLKNNCNLPDKITILAHCCSESSDFKNSSATSSYQQDFISQTPKSKSENNMFDDITNTFKKLFT